MPAISELGRRYTIAEFEAFVKQPKNQERRFELIDGVIVERLCSEEHDIVAVYLAMYVGRFVIKRGLGRIVLDTYRHAPDDEYNDLLPDISFTRKERLQPIVRRGAAPQIPDLVIDIPSPGEKAGDFQAKTHYYLANRAQMVWLAHPATRKVTVYTQKRVLVFTENDTLNGGEACGTSLLPGFKLPVKEIFDFD